MEPSSWIDFFYFFFSNFFLRFSEGWIYLAILLCHRADHHEPGPMTARKLVGFRQNISTRFSGLIENNVFWAHKSDPKLGLTRPGIMANFLFPKPAAIATGNLMGTE